MTELFCNPEQLTTAACADETHACTVANALASCTLWTPALRASAACAADACCTENQGWVAECLVRSSYSHWIIIGLSIFSIVWGVFQAMQVKKVTMDSVDCDEVDAKESRDKMEAEQDPDKKAALKLMLVPQCGKEVVEQMTIVQNHIKDGAKTFLKEEYTKLAIFCAVFSIILACAVDQPW